MKQEFLSPVGRLVQGDPFEAQTKNMQGQPLLTQSGQLTQRYFIAVAFAKNDPQWPAFETLIKGVARADFPQWFDATGRCTHPRFSFKIADGDGVDDNGKPNANKEGFAGHWVVKFSSSFPPRCFYAGKYAPHEQIQDSNAIRRGYFVRVAGTIEGNGQANKPGVYVNLGMLELAGVGPEIVSGPDASAVFGSAPAALPMGAAPLPMHAAAAPAMPAPAMPAPAMPAPAMPAPVAAPALPVVPAPAFLAPPVPPAPVGPVMLPAAGGHTYEQYKASGWSDEQLRAAGYMQ